MGYGYSCGGYGYGGYGGSCGGCGYGGFALLIVLFILLIIIGASCWGGFVMLVNLKTIVKKHVQYVLFCHFQIFYVKGSMLYED